MPRLGSLFTGIGGFDLAAEAVGYTIAYQCEIDPQAQRVLRRYWPEVPRYDDVTELDPRRLPSVDVVVGGFPCQDISIAGRRAGLAGVRSGLFWEFCRVVALQRPRWIVLENVAGLLSSNDGRDLGTVLAAVGDLGYGWAYRVLDARWAGLGQRRRRWFLVGYLGNRSRAAEVLLEPGGVPWTPPTRGETWRDTPAGASDRVDAAVGTGDDVAATLTASSGRPGHNAGDLNVVAVRDRDDDVAVQPINGGGWQKSPTTSGNGIGQVGDPMFTLTAADAKQVAVAIVRSVPADTNLADDDYDALDDQLLVDQEPLGVQSSGNGSIRVRSLTGALMTAPSMTQFNGLLDGPMVRHLTPRECERLQGFPDDWTALDDRGRPISDTARYRFLGNAVAVPVVAWILDRIRRADSGTLT